MSVGSKLHGRWTKRGSKIILYFPEYKNSVREKAWQQINGQIFFWGTLDINGNAMEIDIFYRIEIFR